ncbi:MAG: peptidylprolyl isomerase [Marinobacterium sp.]|nr:peptidylprolyl isomerase [Marinobacterium sp.]
MRRRSLLLALCLAFSSPLMAEQTRVALDTNMGTIELELYKGSAPETVQNFLRYVDDGFYNNTIFHRVIDNFMIQGGGFTQDMERKQVRSAVRNESIGGLSNARGTISMARTSNPHSATSQFFINTRDNLNLDGQSRRPGYTVFGQVVRGMDVVDKISKVNTHNVGPYKNVPSQSVIIQSAHRLP